MSSCHTWSSIRLGEFYPAFFAKTMELENLESSGTQWREVVMRNIQAWKGGTGNANMCLCSSTATALSFSPGTCCSPSPLSLWEAACPHWKLPCIWLPSPNLQLMLGLGPRLGASGVSIQLGKASTQTRTCAGSAWKSRTTVWTVAEHLFNPCADHSRRPPAHAVLHAS